MLLHDTDGDLLSQPDQSTVVHHRTDHSDRSHGLPHMAAPQEQSLVTDTPADTLTDTLIDTPADTLNNPIHCPDSVAVDPSDMDFATTDSIDEDSISADTGRKELP